jgi:hypothetical protein
MAVTQDERICIYIYNYLSIPEEREGYLKEERWKGIERVREEMIEKGETRARAISRLLAVALCSRPVRGK